MDFQINLTLKNFRNLRNTKTIIFSLLVALCCNVYVAIAQDTERPNILLIMTDQHQANALSIMGNNDLKQFSFSFLTIINIII